MSHRTHPIGINQGRGLSQHKHVRDGGVAGDEKERLLLFRKERKVSSPSPQPGWPLARRGLTSAPSLPPHLGKTQLTSLHVHLEMPDPGILSLASSYS